MSNEQVQYFLLNYCTMCFSTLGIVLNSLSLSLSLNLTHSTAIRVISQMRSIERIVYVNQCYLTCTSNILMSSFAYFRMLFRVFVWKFLELYNKNYEKTKKFKKINCTADSNLKK